MKRLRWPLLIVALALVAIGLLLFSQQTVLLPILPDEIEPATGGIYTEALVGSFNRLNPALDTYNSPDHDINRLLFSSLLKFDDRGLAYGDLAESWGVSLDGTVYNFSLRQNAVWHDETPVTSQDIAFTIDLLRHEASLAPADIRDLWSKVQVVALADKMVQFRLPEPFSPFLDYLAFGVLPAHLLGELTPQQLVESSFNLQPVGSGPYRFNQLIVEDGRIAGVVLQAFEAYYGNRPYIDQFVFRYYPDAASALDAYRQGEVLGINRITSDVLAEALKEPRLNFYTGRLPEMTLILLNLDNLDVPYFADPAVRDALMFGLNRQWMVDHVLDGQAFLANGPIFPNTWAYYEPVETMEYNPDQAIEILKKAGYTFPADSGRARSKEGGPPMNFDLLHPDTPKHSALAAAVQKDWSRLGVEVNLVAIPYDQMVTDYLDSRLYQAALVDLNLARSPDPDPYPFWHEAQVQGGQNYSKWSDRQASEYLENARVVVEMSERIKYYRNFQVRFNQELPALPLFYPVYTYAVDAEVQGVRMGPLFDLSDRYATVNSWFLLARRAAAGPADADLPVSLEAETTPEP
jgi:peptide/nickel transport system substrate-binding protein